MSHSHDDSMSRAMMPMTRERFVRIAQSDTKPQQHEDLGYRVSPPTVVTRTRCIQCKCEIDQETYGFLRDYTGKPVPCPTCSPSVMSYLAEKRRKGELERIFGGANIPPAFAHYTFDTYPEEGDQNALMMADAFVLGHLQGQRPQSKRGLWIYGPHGTTKTSLGVSILHEVMAYQIPCLYVLFPELIDMIRMTEFQDVPDLTSQQLIRTITTTEWVMFDDMGVEIPTPYVLKKLYLLIEKRKSNQLYTIFTSNSTPSELESYWRPKGILPGKFHAGMRILDRIREYCVGIQPQCPGLR